MGRTALEIALFEIKYRLRQPLTWGLFAGLLSVAVLFMGGASGGRPRPLDLYEVANSPRNIVSVALLLAHFGMPAVAALVGQAAHRDYTLRAHSLFFSTPMSRDAYLTGRFLGSFAVCTLVFMALPIGLAAAKVIFDHGQLAPFQTGAYLQSFFLFTVPNLFVLSALIFCTSALSKRALPGYVAAVVMVVLYFAAETLLRGMGRSTLATMVDPFGLNTVEQITGAWSAAEKNARLIPVDAALALNRVLWCAIGFGLLAITHAKFRPDAVERGAKLRKSNRNVADEPTARRHVPAFTDASPVVTATSPWIVLRQIVSLARLHFTNLIRQRSFVVLGIAGLALLAVGVREVLVAVPRKLETSVVLDNLDRAYTPFMLAAIAIYAGEIVWRARSARISDVLDVMPTSAAAEFLSRLLALIGLAATSLAGVIVAGVATQLLAGHDSVDLSLYVKTVYGIQLTNYVLWCGLAIIIHTVLNHKYVGHFVVALAFVSPILLQAIGINQVLAHFASDSGIAYSGSTGFGASLPGWTLFKLYWALCVATLATVAILVQVRGYQTAWPARVALARQRLRIPTVAALTAVAVSWIAVGSWIHWAL